MGVAQWVFATASSSHQRGWLSNALRRSNGHESNQRTLGKYRTRGPLQRAHALDGGQWANPPLESRQEMVYRPLLGTDHACFRPSSRRLSARHRQYWRDPAARAAAFAGQDLLVDWLRR